MSKQQRRRTTFSGGVRHWEVFKGKMFAVCQIQIQAKNLQCVVFLPLSSFYDKNSVICVYSWLAPQVIEYVSVHSQRDVLLCVF